MEAANYRPKIDISSYEEIYFNHLYKINKLQVKFTKSDNIPLIIGAINDENIFSAN